MIADQRGFSLSARLTPRDLAWVIAVVMLFGLSFVAIKFALRDIPPYTAVALRFVLAAIPLVFFVRRPRIPWTYVVAYGLAIGFLQFGFLFLGIELGMPAGLSSIVIQVQVFITIGLGIAFLHEHLRAENVTGAIVACAGMVVLAVQQLGQSGSGTFAGFLLVIAAAAAWSVGNIVAKKAALTHADDMFELVVWSSLVPPVPLAVVAYVFEGGAALGPAIAHAGWLTWASILFMAWIATLFGFGSWAKLLHDYPTATIAPFALLIPLSGLASGALFLGERLSIMQGIGALLVFLGLVINVYGPRLRALVAD